LKCLETLDKRLRIGFKQDWPTRREYEDEGGEEEEEGDSVKKNAKVDRFMPAPSRFEGNNYFTPLRPPALTPHPPLYALSSHSQYLDLLSLVGATCGQAVCERSSFRKPSSSSRASQCISSAPLFPKKIKREREKKIHRRSQRVEDYA